MQISPSTLGRASLWAGFVIWTISLLRTPLPELAGSFMHLVNLPFHEAGHILDHSIARLSWGLGAALMTCALIWAAVFALRKL